MIFFHLEIKGLSMDNFRHGQLKLFPKLEYYDNGSACITLFEKNGNEYITVSSNLDNDEQSENKVWICDCGDEHEIAQSMVANALLKSLDEQCEAGHNNYILYELTNRLYNMSKENEDKF